ncbi:MAG: hypothetical protein WBZ24_16455 [Anaerolineales bacterium]
MTRSGLAAGLCLVLSMLACASGGNPTAPAPIPPTGPSAFDSGQTAYGFFPSPPEMTDESLLDLLHAMGAHGEVVLIQRAVPWSDFMDGPDGKSQDVTDEQNLVIVAGREGLEPIFVIDPLNGLDRRQLAPLPAELQGADFGTPALRRTYLNYAVRMAKTFHPRYLGLASEINTYADAHPDDFAHFVDLYKQTYAAIKAESPNTQVFVTFQWDDLNNLSIMSEGQPPFQINWEEVDVFEPQLDLWAISSYPFVAFDDAAQIPDDYYTRLLDRADKRLAVAEGGWPSEDVAPFHGSTDDQIGYLQAIDSQLGGHLTFWIYLVLQDFNVEAYRPFLEAQGIGSQVDTLDWFQSVGLRTYNGQAKPALAVWGSIRGGAALDLP